MTYILNKFFVFVHLLDGFIHWLTQRSTALIVISILFVVIFNNDAILLTFLCLFVIFHVFAGIQTLINDYIHDHMLFLISLTFLRLCVVFLFKALYVVFLC